VTGPGAAAGTTVQRSGASQSVLAEGPDSILIGDCDDNGAKGADMLIEQTAGAATVWWNTNVVSSSTASTVQVTPESALDFAVIVQVGHGSRVSTYTATQTYDSGADICSFTAQVLTTT